MVEVVLVGALVVGGEAVLDGKVVAEVEDDAETVERLDVGRDREADLAVALQELRRAGKAKHKKARRIGAGGRRYRAVRLGDVRLGDVRGGMKRARRRRFGRWPVSLLAGSDDLIRCLKLTSWTCVSTPARPLVAAVADPMIASGTAKGWSTCW